MSIFRFILCNQRFLMYKIRFFEMGFVKIFKVINISLEVKFFKQLKQKLLFISNSGDFY